MRILVCGPRDWTDEEYVWSALDMVVRPHITLLISGCADGVDAISTEWARARGIPILPFVARWRKHKTAAGPIRNRVMLVEGRPDKVYGFVYPGEPLTAGTGDMKKQAEKAGIKVRIL